MPNQDTDHNASSPWYPTEESNPMRTIMQSLRNQSRDDEADSRPGCDPVPWNLDQYVNVDRMSLHSGHRFELFDTRNPSNTSGPAQRQVQSSDMMQEQTWRSDPNNEGTRVTIESVWNTESQSQIPIFARMSGPHFDIQDPANSSEISVRSQLEDSLHGRIRAPPTRIQEPAWDDNRRIGALGRETTNPEILYQSSVHNVYHNRMRIPAPTNHTLQHQSTGTYRSMSSTDQRAHNDIETHRTESAAPRTDESSVNTWQNRCRHLRSEDEIQTRRQYSPPKITRSSTEGYALDMVVTTWTRDSHDLFDYEASPDKIHHQRLTFVVDERSVGRPFLLLRIKYESQHSGGNGQSPIDIAIELVDTSSAALNVLLSERSPRTIQSIEVLFQLNVTSQMVQNQIYYGVSIEEAAPHLVRLIEGTTVKAKEIYEIVRDKEILPDLRTAIKKDMVVKLGRYPVRVRQIVTSGDKPIMPEMDLLEADREAIDRAVILMPEDADGLQCRICLGEGGELSDPLISACACRGSIQYIHATCLRYWFRNSDPNNADDAGQQTSCHIKATLCELCKSQFPPWVMIPNEHAPSETQRFDLTTVSPVMPPFIVLESLQTGNSRIFANTLLRDTPADESQSSIPTLRVGRGHESSMRIPDVSISRVHTEITLDGTNEGFVIKDLGSKFGTLISSNGVELYHRPSVENPSKFDAHTRTSLQCGRSVVDCVLREMSASEVSIPQMEQVRNANEMKNESDCLEVETIESESVSPNQG